MAQTKEQQNFLLTLNKQVKELTGDEKIAFDKLGEITPISENSENTENGEEADINFTKIELESFGKLPKKSFNNSFKAIINKMGLIEGDVLPLVLIGISQLNKDILNPKNDSVMHHKGAVKLIFGNPLKGLPIEKIFGSKGSLLPFEGSAIGDKINFIVTHYEFKTKDENGQETEPLKGLTLSHSDAITKEEKDFLAKKAVSTRAAILRG